MIKPKDEQLNAKVKGHWRWNEVDWPVVGDLTNGGGTSYFSAAATATGSCPESPWTPALHLPATGVALTSLGLDPSSAAAGTALFQTPAPHHPAQLVAQQIAFRVSSYIHSALPLSVSLHVAPRPLTRTIPALHPGWRHSYELAL